jgi:hypothetical protein
MVLDTKDGSGSAATEAATLSLSRLGAYLAIGVGTGALATSAEATPVSIDVSSISGVNGGVSAGAAAAKNDFPTNGGGFLLLFNGYTSGGGRGPSSGLLLTLGGDLGIAAGNLNATPVNFAAGALIDADAGGGTFVSGYGQSLFKYMANVSPDFGPNSFLGFKDALGRFGYIETTWNSTTNEFQILSAAYESVAGVGIRTPSGAAVPEIDPSGLASAMSLVMGSVAMLEQRRRKRAALAAESAAVTA